MTRKQVDLNTCVWGEWHLDVMRRVMLPTLLSPGNLPAISSRFPSRYRIATTPNDRKRIEAWPIFSHLASVIEIDWVTESPAPDITYHIEWYRRSLSDAKAMNACCFTVYPDVAWSDGMLARCADAIRDGKVGIAIPYIRVVSETFVPEMSALAGDGVAKLSSGELVRLGMRHMHPLTVATMASACHALPSLEVMWRVPDQGLLLRQMSRELSMVDTEHLQASQYWNAMESIPHELVHVADDSNDMFILSVAPLLKDFQAYIPDHAVQPIDLARVSLHPVNNNPLVRHIAAHRIRLHYDAYDEARWRKFERRSDDFIDKALFVREFLRIWETVHRDDCSLASQTMSVGLITTLLANDCQYDGPVTAYIPNNRAFRDGGLEDIASMMGPKAEDKLKSFLLDHVVAGVETPADAGSSEQVALGGAVLRLCAGPDGSFINDARIVSCIDVPPHRVCIVDRLLAPAEAATPADARLAKFERMSVVRPIGRILAPAVRVLRTGVAKFSAGVFRREHTRRSEMPASDDAIARDYEGFLRHFGLLLRNGKLRQQKYAAAAALYQYGLYRHKVLFLHDLMKSFTAEAGPTDPEPAFFDYCASLIGGVEDLAKTENYYVLALLLVPNFAEALFALALLKRKAGFATEAIALFKAATEARPHPNAQAHAHISANSWRNLAQLHRDQGNSDMAETSFRRALAHLGNHGAYHVEFAAFLRSRGCYADAARQYEFLMPFSHIYTSHFTEPDYLPLERLPHRMDGRPCDPLTPTLIGRNADGGQRVYWWHVYLELPQGAPIDPQSIMATRPKARLIAQATQQ